MPANMHTIQVRETQLTYSGDRVYNGQFYGPKQLTEFFSPLADAMQEEFWVVGLDSRNSPVFAAQVSMGTINGTLVHAREVFRLAFHPNHSCVGIAVVHNHPSGDPHPSNEDIKLTDRLQLSGHIIGIKLVDHVVIGGEGAYYSFAESDYWLGDKELQALAQGIYE